MIMNKLFEDDDSDDNETSFKTQNEYAKRYDTWREKEELHKLEQKYGDKTLALDSEESDSEDDSDEPPDTSEQMDKTFLKTLALLKTKDPRIYDPSYKFFDTPGDENTKEEIIDEVKSKPKKVANSLAAAFAASDDDSGSEEIFKIEKAPEPQNKKDTLKAYLTGKAEHIDEEADLAPLKALWSDPKINEGEAFLRDYVLDKKYLEVGDGDDEKLRDDDTLEADEELVEEQGKFERAYNFRFEEPDQEYLKRYPRTMNSIRPKDDRRSRKRAEMRTRKDEERARKMEEIARLKALKLKEIQEKIEKIKEVTGNQELAFKDEDIEGPFDPEEHDKRMRAIFDEHYYGEADHKKPVFPDLDEELEIENWDNYEADNDGSAGNQDGPHCEDNDFNMDADYDPNKARTTLMEEIKDTLGNKRRNRKRKSKLAQVLSTEKPKYIPIGANKSYTEYMEEYYKMDCEDVIGGDLPTRFKYRDVVPNDFGLTVEEILLADDKELNSWASLKKTVKYRPQHVEKSEVNTYRQKAQDLQLKKKLIPSLFKDIPEEPELVVQTEKKKKKKNKATNLENSPKVESNDPSQPIEVNEIIPSCTTDNHSLNKREEKKNKLNNIIDDDPDGIKEENVTRNNIEKKKDRKRRKKNKGNGFIVEDISEILTEVDAPSHQNGFITNKNSTEDMDKIQNKKYKRKIKLDEGNELNVELNNLSPLKKKKKQNNNSEQKSRKYQSKVKIKDKNFKKKQQTDKENPLGNLSDERLKAYGLNPKKYRSFLKYKKF